MWNIESISCNSDILASAENLDLKEKNSNWSLSILQRSKNLLIKKIKDGNNCDKRNILQNQLDVLSKLDSPYRDFLNRKLNKHQNTRLVYLFEKILKQIEKGHSIDYELEEIKDTLNMKKDIIANIKKNIEKEKINYELEFIRLGEKYGIKIEYDSTGRYMINDKGIGFYISYYNKKQIETILKIIHKIKKQYPNGKLYTYDNKFIYSYLEFPKSFIDIETHHKRYNNIWIEDDWRPSWDEETVLTNKQIRDIFLKWRKIDTHDKTQEIINLINEFLK